MVYIPAGICQNLSQVMTPTSELQTNPRWHLKCLCCISMVISHDAPRTEHAQWHPSLTLANHTGKGEPQHPINKIYVYILPFSVHVFFYLPSQLVKFSISFYCGISLVDIISKKIWFYHIKLSMIEMIL